MPRQEVEGASFYGLGIAPRLLERLEKIGFTTPTPIQLKAIPIGVKGEDVIGIAQTGTGKTLSFAIPTLQRISATKGRAVVLTPTRELALQVEETFQKVGGAFGLKTAVVIGGASMDRQKRELKKNPHVIIATPGRLIDHLEHKVISLKDTKVLVMDEADRMLDMGFAPQIKRILAVLPKERQTLLFSATMPAAIAKMAQQYMQSPLRVEVAPQGTTAERVDQELFIVPKQDKIRLLEQILSDYNGTVLVFSRTKHGAKKITSKVRQMGHSAAEIHGNRSLAQRKDALAGFKSGKYRVLVATDIAARGIDVDNIELVINFDLPDQAEDYVHRIGRTARAGKAGKAISFAAPEQRRDVDAIEMLIRDRLPIKQLPTLPAARAFADQPDRSYTRAGSARSNRRGSSRSYGSSRPNRSGGGRSGGSAGGSSRPSSVGSRSSGSASKPSYGKKRGSSGGSRKRDEMRPSRKKRFTDVF